MSPRAGDGFEREIKIPVADLGAVRRRLRRIGAELAQRESLERNRVFDRAAGGESLLAGGRLLRLREDGSGARLTYKGPARFAQGVKIREERELAIDDAEIAVALLSGLGFEVARRYEKRRETWTLAAEPGASLVTLDRTPIGDFVEVEVAGEAGSAVRLALRLGLDPATAEPRSYLALYDDWRGRHPGAPRDMVFPVAPDPGPNRCGG
ncbi:MAG TPA: class IV adenylate cyclase [Thermoanaerobaculia bacterium]|nr:class IV adenylate cyclase [Thermoanaerobaculia bacterium]